MNKTIRNGIALLQSGEPLITGAQSALDLIADISYNDGCEKLALNKEAFSEDFFKLSTGLAGEILQKFANYRKKLAIYGDFSSYTSKPLRDFMYECNRGEQIFFVENVEAALEKLLT
jgi:hypothetical protein